MISYDSSVTLAKERDFWAKPSSLGETFIGIRDPKIPRFLDSAYWAISKLQTSSILKGLLQDYMTNLRLAKDYVLYV